MSMEFYISNKEIGKKLSIRDVGNLMGEICWNQKIKINDRRHKVEKILKGSLDSIPSPSPSKFKLWAGKFV